MKELFYEIWQTYLSIAPYLFIGLTFAGLLHLFFKKDFIAKHLGQNDFLAVVKAAVLGVPLPLCSCGVIPTALYLKREKASNGATLSFLISTPQTGVDSMIATYGMMGPVFAIFRPIAAFITGIVGGVIANVFHLESKPIESKFESCESGCCSVNVTKPKHKFQKFFDYAYHEFLDDIALQLVVGIILAGMISYFVPADFFAKYGGDSFVGMLLMIVVGIPLYVCATGSIPIAVSLILKGISPGAAFVFLVVGPATNAATITLIGNAMGKKIVIVYLSVIAIFAVLGGYALNFVMKIFTPNFAKNLQQTHAHSENSIILIVITIIFSVLLMMSIYRRMSAKFKYKFKEVKVVPTEQIVKIEGMTCNHCVMNATKAIETVDGVTKVKVMLDAKKAIIEGDFDLDQVKKAIENSGYSVKG